MEHPIFNFKEAAIYIAKYLNNSIKIVIILSVINIIFNFIVLITLKTGSPVEEMYHRQLVATIDSIIDAKNYEEVVDSDDVTVPHDQFGRVILPSEYK